MIDADRIPCPRCGHEGPHEPVPLLDAHGGLYRVLLCKCFTSWKVYG